MQGDAVWCPDKQSLIVHELISGPADAPTAEQGNTHGGARPDAERLQRPGQAQTHQDVKHITAYGVGDGHVSQT